MADDTPDLESFYVGRLTDRQGDDYRPVTDEDRETKWSDYGRALGSGALNLGSGVAGVAEYATQGKVGSDARRWLDKQAEETVDNMTPVAKRALNSSFIADEGEDSILDTGVGRSLALKVTAASPSLVASVIPAGVVGAALRGASLATRVGAAGATARATAGVLSAGDVVNNIYGTIDKMSDEQLAQQSSVFAGYLSMGMDPTDAREKYMRDVAGSAPIVAGAVSAMLAGTEVDIAKILAGGAKKGFVLGAKEGVINEGRQEMAETFTGEFLSAQALADAGLSEISWQKILSKTIEGGVVGGLIGGTAGGASNLGGATPSAPPKGNTTGEAPPPPAVPDLGNTTNPPGGSETQYPKVKAAISVSKKRGGVAVVDGPVGATEAAALSPQVSPEITQKVAGLEATSEVTPPPAPVSPPVPPEIAEKAAGVTESEAPATTPETPDQITAQFADLVSSENPRSVVFIPNGNKTAIPDEVSSNPNFDTVKLGKAYPADTRGQYVYDKTKTDPVAIRKAAKTGTLGELLGMGPTNKAQAVADIAAGAQPLAIQVRDENGTPKVEQGTSSATVAQDVPVVQANANPTDTIEVTTPEAVQGERLAPAPAPAPALEPAKPNVGPKAARVLEAIGNKEVQEATNQKLQENVKAAKVAEKKAEKQAEKVATGPANDELVGKYAGKDAKRAESRAKRDSIAKSVFEEAAPTEAEANWNSKDAAQRKAARQAIVERVQRALVKAQQLFTEAQKEDPNFKMPTKMSPQMVNELVWLLEAQRFLSAVGRKDGGRTASYQEFVGKETSYRSADQGKAARAERRQGGDEAKRVDQGDVQEKADTIPSDVREASSPEAKLIAEEEDVPLQESRTGDELYQEGRERTRARSDEEVEASAQLGKAEKALEDAKADRTTTPEKRQELEKAVKDASDRYIASKKEKKYVAGEETGETDARGNPKFTQKAAAAVNKRPKFDAGRPAVAGKVTLGSRKAAQVATTPKPAPSTGTLNPTTYETGKAFVADVYHGTRAVFDRLSMQFLGNNTGAESAKKAFFFAQSGRTSNVYAGVPDQLPQIQTSDIVARAKQGQTSPELAQRLEYLSPEQRTRYSALEEMLGKVPSPEPVAAKIRALLREADPLAAERELARLRMEDPSYDLKGETPRTLLSRIQMTNPLVVDFEGAKARPERFADIIERAKADGHDGVVFRNVYDGAELDTVHAVFDEAQISDKFNPGRAPDEIFPNKNEYGDPLPDEANKVQSAIEGKTVVQVAKWLENNAPRSSHRMVAKRVRIVLEKMQAAGVKFSFTVLHNGDTTPRNSGSGWRGVNILKYDQGRLQNDVYIVGADVTSLVGTSYEVVLHELIHAATKSVTFMGTRRLSADLKIAKLAQELTDVSDAIVKHFNQRAKMGNLTSFEQAIFKRMNNALANQDEILTWALSNEQMQEYLDGIEYKNTKQSLLKRIITVIGEFFGIPATQGSALEEVLRVGEKIFDADETLPEVLEAHSRFTSLNKIEPSLESFFNPAIDANISSYIPELKDRQASVQGWAGRTWTKFRAFNQLEQDFRGTVFGPALTKINEARQAAGPRARNLKDRGDALASRLIDFERKNKAEAMEITSLAQEARLLGVSLEGKNDLGTDDSAHWQAKKLLPGLQARFNNNLSGEAKQIYRDMVSFYSDSHNMIVKASVKGILQQLLLKNKLTEAEIAGLTDRVINKKMNDTDKALLGKTMFDNLKNAAEFHKVEGDYFPLMRFGDHVVRTEDTVKDTMGGTLEGNAVLFRNKSETAARKAAQAFAEKTDLVQLGRAEKTYFDRATGKEVTADEAKSLNDVDYGFRVRVQTQGVYFFESEKEAHAFVRTNPEGHDVVRAPEQRMGSGYQAHILSGTQLGVMEKSVDGRKDLSDGQKALIKSIIAQSSARMVSGNRIASRRLKSQKVTGASTDTARVLLQYNTAMSRHVSTAEAAPEIRDGLDKLNKLLETYEGNDRPAIVSMIEEVKARIDQGIHEPNEASQLMKDVLTTSSIARLFSPMYTAIQMVQPWMSTLPMLGGRFGNVRAASAMSQAYSDLGLGEAAVSGFLNTARATKQFSRAGLLNTDNIVANMRARFASDAGVTAMLDRAIELGSIDVNAGLEVASAVADGRGRIGLIIAGTDRIARQLPQMAEAVNRVSTGVAAYRLARESGMSQEKATQFAIDTINNTQGDYSASNAPRFFNNPILRPAMQFRKYAQMMTYLLVDLAKRTMNSDLSVEERKIAGKQLLNFVGVQIAMAGALSLPGLELVKAGFLIASVFGLGGGWDDQEEKLRKLVDQTFGRPLGQMITNGVFTRLGGYGIDVSQRMSLSDMWLFGEPRKNDSESQQAYLFRLMAGSSGSFLLGVADGVKDIGNGEIEKGLGKVLPVKFAADTAKAVGAYNKDRTGEVGLGTVAVNAFGVKTAAQAEKSRDIADAMRRKDERESKRKALSKAFYEARTPGERAKAVAKNREWNAQLSKSEWRLRLPTNAGAL